MTVRPSRFSTICLYCSWQLTRSEPRPTKPRVFLIYTYCNVYGLKEAAKNAWKGYMQNPGITSKDCADCGYCEKKCPQHLKIRELLKKAEDVLNAL